MKRKLVTILDDIALSRLTVDPSTEASHRVPGDWIRILRNYLRMTQSELAQRAHITQPNLAAIESGKVDPQLGTLRRIYEGLSCTSLLSRDRKSHFRKYFEDVPAQLP